jgi:hypothetical protein
VAALTAAHPLWQAAQARALEMIGRANWDASAPVLRRIASSSAP